MRTKPAAVAHSQRFERSGKGFEQADTVGSALIGLLVGHAALHLEKARMAFTQSQNVAVAPGAFYQVGLPMPQFLLVGITALGVAPAPILDAISASVAGLNLPL